MSKQLHSTSRRSWGALRHHAGLAASKPRTWPMTAGVTTYCPHTFDTRMDAEGWLQAERKLIERDEWTPPEIRAKAVGYVTLRDYAEQWLAHRDLAPTTRSVYRNVLRLRINNHLGDELLQAITPAMIRAWWVGLPKDTRGRNAHAYRVLYSIFNTGDRR